MPDKKRVPPAIKSKLHPRNKHRSRYDFQALNAVCPDLAPYVNPNKYGDLSINFFQPEAVKMLNKALLQRHYGIQHWDIPEGYLCPPIPGRADYIHYIADLLASTHKGIIPRGKHIKCLDIGVGANCIYPILGHQEYGWSFIGSDIDKQALAAAQQTLTANPSLETVIELRLQTQTDAIFKGILHPKEQIDISICNPPFHSSKAEAQAGTRRKLRNLKGKKQAKTVLNFGGQRNELWCKGGELAFLQKMITESVDFANNCTWFSSLVSKEAHLKPIYQALRAVKATQVETIPMGQGHKVSRVVAWCFLQK